MEKKFNINLFLLLLALYFKLWMQMHMKRLKKPKELFYKLVLEFS